MGLKNKLFSGSAIRLVHLFSEIIIGFLLMPFLISELTDKWYGLWLLVASITGFFALLTLGLSSAVQRFLSYEISSESLGDYKQTISSALFIFTLTAFVVVALSLGIGQYTEYFVDDTDLQIIFSSLILVVGCNFAMRFFSTPFNAALTAEFHFTLVSFLEILGFLVKSILTVYFVKNDYGVIGVGYALLIGEAVANFAIAVLALYKLKYFRFSFRSIKKKKVLALYEFGLNSFIATLGVMLRFPLGNIVISGFVGLSAVTIYSIPVRLLSYADAFVHTTLGVLQPYFTKLYAEKKIEKLQEHFLLASKLSLAIGGVLTGGLIVFGADFISLWVNEYSETKLLTYILPLTLLFGICQQPSVMVLYALGKHRYFAYLNIAEAVVNISIAMILIHYIGVVGVALAVLIPMLFTKGWLLPRYVCRQLALPGQAYYLLLGKAYLFILLYSVLWLNIDVAISTWSDILLYGAIYAMLFMVFFAGLIANKSERSLVISLVIKRIKRNA